MSRIMHHPILGELGPGKAVTIYFDGNPLEAVEGEVILATLLAHGIRVNRTTRLKAEPRGMFCGIGRCTDCIMKVDGVPNVRTCLTRVKGGMVVETQQKAGTWKGQE
jgi:predicted molibdopterin-dependent oxidoreductase YjgC